jgi:predicted DCC family thiol-disulfide oxidoreductase YuxK
VAPAAKLLLLYDGECRFCVAGSTRLAAMARHPHAPQNPDASTLRLVSPDGHVAEGAEAVALALGTRPLWRLVTWVYWLPVVRPMTDAVYRVIARHRFKIMGRVAGRAGGTGEIGGAGGCEDGVCRVETVESRRG